MTMDLNQLIKEAEKRGIVPGAFVESAFCPGMWRTITGRPYSPFNGALYAPISGGSITVYWEGKWSNVKQQQQDMKKKLEPRTVCDTTPAQQQYIYGRANELGLKMSVFCSVEPGCPSVQLDTNGCISRCIPHSNCGTGYTKLSFAEFCERMENTAAEKITVRDIAENKDYEVVINGNDVMIGCFALTKGDVIDIENMIHPTAHVKVKGQAPLFNDIQRYVRFAGGHCISYDDIQKVYDNIIK